MRRRVRGTVKSSKMDKTISVVVEHLARHPRYEKHVRRSSTFKAHDARNEAQVGDLVEIEETRPLSKTKHWRLVRVVKHALSAPLPEVESASVEPQAAP